MLQELFRLIQNWKIIQCLFIFMLIYSNADADTYIFTLSVRAFSSRAQKCFSKSIFQFMLISRYRNYSYIVFSVEVSEAQPS